MAPTQQCSGSKPSPTTLVQSAQSDAPFPASITSPEPIIFLSPSLPEVHHVLSPSLPDPSLLSPSLPEPITS